LIIILLRPMYNKGSMLQHERLWLSIITVVARAAENGRYYEWGATRVAARKGLAQTTGSGGGTNKEVVLLLLLLLLLLTLPPPGMQCCAVRVPNIVAATSCSDGAIALRRAPRNIANLRYTTTW